MSRFKEILNEEYDSMFMDVLNSDLVTIDNKMNEIFEKSKTDDSLSDNQKDMVKKLNTIYKFATFSVKYEPLSMWYISTKPNLAKIIWGGKSNRAVSYANRELSKRLKRGVEDIATVMQYIDIPNITNSLYNFPNYFDFIGKQFKQKEATKMELYVLAAVVKYAKNAYHDIMYSWYLAIFFKTIELLATTKLEVIVDNGFMERVKKIFILGELLSNDKMLEYVEKQQKEALEDNGTDNNEEIHE